jgi:heterodisulfide reductase subunit A
VDSIEGEPGNFKLSVIRKPRYVDPTKCTGCGVCAQYCPVEAIDFYNVGMGVAPGIFVEYQQAVPLIYTINRDVCIGCGLCSEYCEAGAVDYEQKEQREVLHVGAVILAPGTKTVDMESINEFGYGKYKNVVNSIEFERILSASGPFRGLVLRPYDGVEPEKICFIQCAGSRSIVKGNEYCSSACCMYAVKEAMVAKEHLSDLSVSIFYMDIRAYGKDFDKYVERAKKSGIEFKRCRVSNVIEDRKTRNLLVTYETEEGKIETEEYGMVVLSHGLRVSSETSKLAEKLGIEVDRFGFCRTGDFTPMETSKSGVFVSGSFQGPKDIPETVMQSSGAASLSSQLLSDGRNTMITKEEYPEKIDVMGIGPRIGVFVCYCGINIGGYVDVPAVAEYAKTLEGVVFVDTNLFTCSQDSQELVKQKIIEQKLNRVVIASCTPRTHEPLFQETCESAGLNRYLFSMANIRDQCSWVHMQTKEEATEKAKELVRMSVAKARLLEPLERLTFDLTKRGLVIGGGLAGLTAALGLAKQGYEAILVEREKELGGNLGHIHFTLSGENPQELLKSLLKEVDENKNITVYKNSEIVDIAGFIGNYKTKIKEKDSEKEHEVEHGVVIIATGGKENVPKEYQYGKSERILTQHELEELLAENRSQKSEIGKEKNEKNIKKDVNLSSDLSHLSSMVMIQCVGSRDEEHPYCSRYCCSQAVKNALKVKEKYPDVTIYILFRDIRTYGTKEIYYTEAREKGIIFIRFDEDKKPEVSLQNGSINVRLKDPIIKRTLSIDADYLILSTGMVPQEDNDVFGKMLKVPLNQDGFYLEAHMKLRPVDFATDGVFMCGICHSPKMLDETIAQASAAVSRACTILSQDEIKAEGTIAFVNKEKCAACGTCESVCPFGAVKVVVKETRWGVERYAEVTEALCKGCGACASSCRMNAIDIKGFSNKDIFAMIENF